MSALTLIIGSEPTILQKRLEKAVQDAQTAHPDAGLLDMSSIATDMYATSLFDPFLILRGKEPTSNDIKRLTAYLDNPLDDRVIIITSTKPLAAFAKKVSSSGGTVIQTMEKKASDTVLKIIAPLNLTMRAKNKIIEHVGEEPERAISIVNALETIYQDGDLLDLPDVENWLYEAGAKTTWALLDAIDAGNPSIALTTFNRNFQKETSAVGLAIAIRSHFEKIYFLSAAGITNEHEGKEFLGYKSASTYPAKKAIQLAKRYKSAAEHCLALSLEAEAALRGGAGSGLPEKIVLELLIGRVCSYPRR